MKFKDTLVTPDLARNILDGSAKNRSVRDGWVRSLSGAMSRGEWSESGETIKFDENGKLVDGQHRLYAVIKSGCTVTMTFATGVNGTASNILDSGKRRTDGDRLMILGYERSGIVATALLWLQRFEEGTIKGNTECSVSTFGQRMAHLTTENDIEKLAKLFVSFRLMNKGLAIALYVLMDRKDALLADLFFEKLRSGRNIGRRDVVGLLREFLIRNKSAHRGFGKVAPNYIAAVTIKAWNSVRPTSRRELKFLKWAGNEEFPDVE